MSTEVDRAGLAEAVLSSALSTEVVRAGLAEAVLSSALSTEVVARIASDTALELKISDVYIAPYATGIFADGGKPIPMPLNMMAVGHQGWYYTNDNSQPDSSGNRILKINWYMVNNNTDQGSVSSTLNFNASVGAIKEINIPVTLLSKTSTPFITIYTKVKVGATGNYASWYRAKKTWTIDGDSAGSDYSTLAVNGKYLFRVNVNTPALTASYPGYTNIDLKPSVVAGSTNGPFSNDDEIFLISIGTDSGSSQGNVSFIVKHFEMRTTMGNKKTLFSNDTVLSYRMFERLQTVYSELYQTSASVL